MYALAAELEACETLASVCLIGWCTLLQCEYLTKRYLPLLVKMTYESVTPLALRSAAVCGSLTAAPGQALSQHPYSPLRASTLRSLALPMISIPYWMRLKSRSSLQT